MTPLYDGPELLVSEGPGLIVLFMRRSPNDAVFTECGNRVREVLTRQARINVVILISNFDGEAGGSRAAQKAFATLLGDLHAQLVSTCIVITVPGLKGTMIRLTVNAILMLGKLRNPVQIHASIPETVTWLRSQKNQVPSVTNAPNLLQELERVLK